MTIFDIAAEAGVSISTVSRVINTPERVKAATRERVQSILEKHHYTPNAIARGLVHNSMRTIGVLTSDVRRLQFSLAAHTLEGLFFNWRYSTIVCNTGYEVSKMLKYIRVFSEKQVDGLVLLGSIFCEREIIQAISRYLPETPIIVTNGMIPLPNVYSVITDHECGARLLIEHLFRRNRRKILFVYQADTNNARRKIEGFKKVMGEFGLPVVPGSIWESGRSDLTGESIIEEILRKTGGFDAIICAEDMLAVGMIKYLTERDLQVPEDVAVCGYVDTDFCRFNKPPITALDSKVEITATIVANTLRSLLTQEKGSGSISSITIRPELIVREST